MGVLALGASAFSATAQAPDEAWRTIETDHFRVTFPERLEALGRKAADRAERAWDELEAEFLEPPDGMIDVLVTDHTDVSNGFAQVVPTNRIVVFARPPVDALSLGHTDEWMELVITHELAHIVHLDHVENPIGKAARALFGRVSMEWPFFPETGTPRWLTEGVATWYESRLTDAGRVHGTFLEMQIRTAALEGRFEDIGQASGESPLWPGGNRAYAYGSLFFDFLLHRHGEEKMTEFVDAIAGQWIPYRLDSAGRSAFGVSLTEEWNAWSEAMAAEVADLDASLSGAGPVTEPEPLTTDARWALHPSPSPDGRWIAYARSDGRSDLQIELIDATSGAARPLGRTNGLATFSWTPDGRLLVSQREFRGPYRNYADLYLFDLDGTQERLTSGARLTQPSVHPDGLRAVAIQEGDGSNSIVWAELATGSTETLVAPADDLLWAFPRLSPDGRWIAATRWRPDANHDLVVLEASTGRVVHEVTRDRALDLAASWSPDGRWLTWTSDRSGILNILGAEFDATSGRVGTPVQLTNVRTGAAYPAIDPAGSWLYISGYHLEGWEIERIPFEPGQAPEAAAAVARFAPDLSRAEVRGSATGEVRGYSALPTLKPSYWEIAYDDAVVSPRLSGPAGTVPRRELLGFSIGLQTSARDLVGRHAYAAEARVTTTGAKVEGGLSYSYSGLGNPVLSLRGTQRYRSGLPLLQGATPDTLFVLERRREIEGAVSFLAPSWRRNVVLTLSAGLELRDGDLLDPDLSVSSTYRLTRPNRRFTDLTASLNLVTSRSHSFQMGIARGINLFVLGRRSSELDLTQAQAGVAGEDGSVNEIFGRIHTAIPLWSGGFARHTLALRASGGIASGPGADAFHYRVGGASGRRENLTGLELFGGDPVFFPVRGYPTSWRFGRYAWSATAEYRFPILMLNRGFRAWPVHLDRMMGAVFFDTGNAWGPDLTPQGNPNGLRVALASVGAEATLEMLGLYDVQLRIRGGVAFPLVETTEPLAYVRVGLPF